MRPVVGHRGTSTSSALQSGPQGEDAGLSNNNPKLASNFTGLNSVDQLNAYGGSVNGFVLEPPDQGLCAGTLFGSSVVFEIINDVAAVYAPNGTLLLGPVDLNTFFGESPALNVSDPRCVYDSTTQTWFFSAVIYTNDLFTDNHTDVLVLNGGNGSTAVYPIDTVLASNSAGQCPCFGDQPKIGIDQNNIYISVDQFNSPATIDETGADVFALSKSQLAAESTSVNSAAFLNLSIGIGVTGLQPAITSGGSNNEFLLNAFPYLDEAQLQPNPTSTQLGLWALSDTDAVTEGGTPTLSETTIASEQYNFPVPALTTNGLSLATFTLDSRMQQVQFINGELWGALSSAVAKGHDPKTKDGVAWFEIAPSLGAGGVTGGTFTDQGYVSAAGKYLVYPAIVTTPGGSTGIAFSITSPNLNPSTGYVLRKAGDKKFSNVHLTDKGSGPDTGFTCVPPFQGTVQQCRWGDYSWAALDPSGAGLWMAAELTVPQVATQILPPIPGFPPTLSTNWGTQVWEVNAP